MDKELERFKTEIDLRQFAASLGYGLDVKDSWRGAAVMRNGPRGSGDKVVISRDTDSHYVYYSFRDESDNGTIIDFVSRRTGRNLGEVRKTLRPWIGETNRPPLPLADITSALEKVPKDLVKVEMEWRKTVPYERSAYLEDVRKIPGALLHSARFKGCLRIATGRFSNVLFPHHDITGALSGFEKKNEGFTGFAGGGEKGLWSSNDFPEDTSIVFAESGIDALSYATLFPDSATRYRSFAGGLNPDVQPLLLRAHIEKLKPGSKVIAAVDADKDGLKFANSIEELSRGYAFKAHRPSTGDWNDVLRDSFLPTARYANEP